MKSRFALALAAVLLVATPQLAQAQFMDINSIIAGIGGNKFLTDAARADDAAGLRVVRLSTLAGAEQSASRLYSVVESKRSDIEYLQGNLVINPMALSAIRRAGFSLQDIVSLDVSGDGGGVLYANDL